MSESEATIMALVSVAQILMVGVATFYLAYAIGIVFFRAIRFWRGPYDKTINRDRRDRPITPQDWRR